MGPAIYHFPVLPISQILLQPILANPEMECAKKVKELSRQVYDKEAEKKTFSYEQRQTFSTCFQERSDSFSFGQ